MLINMFQRYGIQALIFGLFVAVIHSAQAAGWVSSGGELFELDRNPWFVKNVEEVKYCIDLDEEGVSADRATVETTIEAAINYWKRELDQKHSITAGLTKLGTQKFVYVGQCPSGEGKSKERGQRHFDEEEMPSCEQSDQGIEVAFRIGYQTLTPKEVEFLADPQKYVGVSLRKRYCDLQMRGRGIIFIASDRGDHSYHNPGHLVSEAWQQPKLLQYALIHELGHLFGISHSGSGIMSEVFLDQLLNKNFVDFYAKNPVQSFFSLPERFGVCPGPVGSGTFDPGFFGVPGSSLCLILERKADSGGQWVWSVSALEKVGEDPVPYGDLTVQVFGGQVFSRDPASIIHLPKGQSVFSREERGLSNFMIGPFYSNIGATAFFKKSGSNRPYSAYLQMTPGNLAVLAQGDTGIKMILTYTPPQQLTPKFPLRRGAKLQ